MARDSIACCSPLPPSDYPLTRSSDVKSTLPGGPLDDLVRRSFFMRNAGQFTRASPAFLLAKNCPDWAIHVVKLWPGNAFTVLDGIGFSLELLVLRKFRIRHRK